MTIHSRNSAKKNKKKDEFSVNEFIQRTSPHKKEPGETTTSGTGDFILVRNCHGS